jgi:hypothetical protein
MKKKEKEGKNALHKICMTYHAILHGLVVMAVNSQSEGPGFEYQSSENPFLHFPTHLRLSNHILGLDMQLNNF